MSRAFANSRLALILRRLRGRFGISAPRVAVRAHIPWYWRVLSCVFLLIIAVVLVGWVYDTGRRIAGYDRQMTEQELDNLRGKVANLESEAEHLRSLSNASESTLQIERTAQQRLSEQAKRLEIENGRLREDLAAFENLASGADKSVGIGIHRLQVESDPTVEGRYHYRLLLSAPGFQSDREFAGHLQLNVTALQNGKTVMLTIPDAGSADAAKYLVNFKYFRRIEGNLILPPNTAMKKFEIRLLQGANVVASQQASI
jgi:hypothetical protein